MKYIVHRRIPLRSNTELTEKWVQQLLVADPGLLGLGDIDVKDVERRQPHAGRLDLLLFDSEANTRYEVEVQLGATDESHIIRTIEYWDTERRRYPQYDHVGVIVAEEITARFFNVISLFNGFIPLVAIQMSAIQVADDAVTLVFTKVLDLITLGLEEEDEGEPTDRKYWEARSNREMLQLTDRLLGLVRQIDPEAVLKYNKHYIGLAKNGVATNYLTFRPRKKHVTLEFKIPRSDEISNKIEVASLASLPYDVRWGAYRPYVGPDNLEEQAGLLLELIRLAHDTYSF
jgi:hypothetical protein